jgi:erythromycin esterase-like protein
MNIGQLARERYGEASVFIVGFGSYEGSVVAGKRWGAPMQKVALPPAREESWEQLIHYAQPSDQLLLSEDFRDVGGFQVPRGEPRDRSCLRSRDGAVWQRRAHVSYASLSRVSLCRPNTRTASIARDEHFTGDAPDTYLWGL